MSRARHHAQRQTPTDDLKPHSNTSGVPSWTDERAEIALRAVEGGSESEMAPLPSGWGETLTGEPMLSVMAAVHRSRDSH